MKMLQMMWNKSHGMKPIHITMFIFKSLRMIPWMMERFRVILVVTGFYEARYYVEYLIGVYYVEGGKNAVVHLMNWIEIMTKFHPK